MPIRGVLFDWHGTLFHDLGDGAWIRSTAALIGREIDTAEADRLSQAITAASSEPEVRAASFRADASVEANRRAVMLLFKTAGLDEELARAVWERNGTPGSCIPYPDTPGVLAALTARGYRIAIVSDIHFDLRPIFERHDLARFIHAWALSFEHGWVKPEPEAFACALNMLQLAPGEVLMVGDRASRDGGAAAVGITTLLLPAVPNFSNRGLDAVLRLLGEA